MNIVFFSHPVYFGENGSPAYSSMPRFTNMLADGMRERGHTVEIWSPKPQLVTLPLKRGFKKWLGYIDSYVLFPAHVRAQLKKCSANTLFVFTDHALGMWVPLIAQRPHVIHCHDFLAQQSALGKIPEIVLSRTGKIYQNLIHKGFSKGKHFISVSQKTRKELIKFLYKKPVTSELVYNGLSKLYKPLPVQHTRSQLGEISKIDLISGYILHVGGNQWYKNRVGVIEIYNSWRHLSNEPLPLILIGEKPSSEILAAWISSPFQNDIHFFSDMGDEFVRLAYSGASVFVFPSLAEGFGWPIAEAMASGCPVVTTNEAPMTEVAGKAGFYIPKRPIQRSKIAEWADNAAKFIEKVIHLSKNDRQAVIDAGILNIKRFNKHHALNKIESIYRDVLLDAKVVDN